jgi:putative peptide maturation dehydrogenase
MSQPPSFAQVRRRQPCFIEIGDTLLPDLSALFMGRVELQATVTISLLCPFSGERLSVTADELQVMATLSADAWTAVESLPLKTAATRQRLDRMVELGLLVSDSNSAEQVALRDGEARLKQLGWHGLAAVYHARTRWSAIVGDEGVRDHSEAAHLARLEKSVTKNGLPPTHLPVHDQALERVQLPPVERRGALWQLLQLRATTRAFNREAWLRASALAEVLQATFAPLGQRALGTGLVALRRASPSGGGLHPIEAYVLVVRVEGIDSGVYHYEGAAHRLTRLQAFDEAEARALVERHTIGQTYFSEAHALVFHVARAHRNFWKYRRHPKAYKVLFADAGHLSQTFYLAAAAQGLGAFYTGAINDADVCQWLGLDPLEHVVVGANGLGIIDPSRDELHLRPSPMPGSIDGLQAPGLADEHG